MRKKFDIFILTALILSCLAINCVYAENQQVLVLPASTKIIETEAFCNDTSIREVVLPEGVETIGVRAFYNCKSLTSVYVPSSVTSIGTNAFAGCPNLTICGEAGTKAEEYASENGVKFVKLTSPVEDFTYTIADNCCTITGYDGNDSKVIVPDEIEGYPVTAIGKNAFLYKNCVEIKLPNGVRTIGENAFSFCQKLTFIRLPDSLTTIEKSAFRASHHLPNITLPYGVEHIGARAFEGCGSISSIVIPNSVNFIGDSAFQSCTALKSIVLSNGLTAINDRLFYECCSLNNIIIPTGIESIGQLAFFNCTSLSSVALPTTLICIENNSFALCESLTDIVLPYSLQSIGYCAFRECKSLTKLVLPYGITEITDMCFIGCSSLQHLYIPETVEQIYLTAFGEKSYLVGTGWVFRPDVPETFIIYGKKGSFAETFAAENGFSFGTSIPISIPNPSENAIPEEYYEIVNSYCCSGRIYYEVNLIKEYNGVSVPDPNYSTKFFFLDSQGCVVTDPTILCKLYTIYMYVHNEKTINKSITNLNNNARIWSATALDFLMKDTLWTHTGGLAGELTKAYTGGKVDFKGLLKLIFGNVWKDAKEAEELGSWLEIAFIWEFLDHLDQLTTISGNIRVQNGNGAYDYDGVRAKLIVYTHFMNTYNSVKGICIPVVEGICEKFESDSQVGMYYVSAMISEFGNSMTSHPFFAISMTVINQIVRGDQDELDVASNVFSLIDKFAGINLEDCVQLYESLGNLGDVLESVLGISQAYALEEEGWLEPFYMTDDELKTTQLYKNHLLLAQ